MLKPANLLAASCLSLAVAGCGGAIGGDELAAFKAAIRAKYDLKEAAFAADDPSYIVNEFYSADVISTDPEGKTYYGRAGIAPLYAAVIADTAKITSRHTRVNGDMGWDWADFHVMPADASVKPFTFKILFLWERVEGDWVSRGEMYVPGSFAADKPE